MRTLMLEGGGRINGSMLRAGLVDEVSLLVAPVIDGRMGTPAVFDEDGDVRTFHRLALESVERRADDLLWLRYRVIDSESTQSLLRVGLRGDDPLIGRHRQRGT